MAIVKQGTSDWSGNNRKMTSHNNFKVRFSKRNLVLVRGFSMNLMRFDNFRLHGKSSHEKSDIVKQEMSDLPGNNGKMTSHSNFTLRFSRRPLDLVEGFLFQFGLI